MNEPEGSRTRFEKYPEEPFSPLYGNRVVIVATGIVDPCGTIVESSSSGSIIDQGERGDFVCNKILPASIFYPFVESLLSGGMCFIRIPIWLERHTLSYGRFNEKPLQSFLRLFFLSYIPSILPISKHDPVSLTGLSVFRWPRRNLDEFQSNLRKGDRPPDWKLIPMAHSKGTGGESPSIRTSF